METTGRRQDVQGRQGSEAAVAVAPKPLGLTRVAGRGRRNQSISPSVNQSGLGVVCQMRILDERFAGDLRSGQPPSGTSSAAAVWPA